jgi:K+-sensing histidine kinase KdpD
MISAQLHNKEPERLRELLRLEIMDTEDEQAFDDLTELASSICGTPISLISLVDDHRQWFKSKVGLDASETEKDIAFCSHAILQDQIFEVTDALQDERFADNPLVIGAPDIRFYAGAPLVTEQGLPIGTLCVIDQTPKELTQSQRKALRTLANQVISQLEMRLNNKRLKRINREREQLFAMISHDLRSPFNGILGFARMLNRKAASLDPERLQQLGQSIQDSSLQVYQLLEEILQWSQQRMGALSPNLEPQVLRPLVESSLQLLGDLAEAKSINLCTDIDTQLVAIADVTLTKALIRNLVGNAIKFSPKGSQVDVHACTTSEGIKVCVTDQGQGIASHLREELFQHCVESTMGTACEQGTGLGLSLCQEFAEQQGGKIWLEQSGPSGTSICFLLSAP